MKVPRREDSEDQVKSDPGSGLGDHLFFPLCFIKVYVQ